MATRNYAVTEVPGEGFLVTWAGLLNGDDGQPYNGHGLGDRSVQFVGTFGAGGTIVFEGSNDAATYASLTDPQGNAISKTATGIEQVMEAARQVRPRVTAGDGTTTLNAYLFIRGERSRI